MRRISTAFQEALTVDHLQPIFLADLDFAPDPARFWSGVGELEFDGKVFTGSGYFGEVSNAAESDDGRANGMILTLHNLPIGDSIGEIMNELRQTDWQGRRGSIELGLMDGHELLATETVFSGLMDNLSARRDGAVIGFELTLESRLINLRRTPNRRYTNEDQKSEYPDDTGFRFVPFLQDIEVVWGVEGPFFRK